MRGHAEERRTPGAAPLRIGPPAWLAHFVLLAALLWPTAPAPAADLDRPHPHRGVVEPFEGKPPLPTLNTDDLEQLAHGHAVLKQIDSHSGGRGVAVEDIHARPETVWDRIGDFRAYPRMVAHVSECEPYLERGDDVRVRFVLGVFGLRYEYFVRHVFRPQQGYVTWTLDYSRESDLDDSVGYWVVQALAEKPGWSRLFYSIDMRTRGWMPGFLRRMIANEGLRDATQWVKREAEAAAQSSAPG